MDHSEVKHLPKVDQESAKPKRFSDAIRIGCWISGPTSELRACAYVMKRDGRCFTCILGAAALGLGKDVAHLGLVSAWMADHFKVPHSIVMEAQMKYESDRKSREEVADWLGAQGY